MKDFILLNESSLTQELANNQFTTPYRLHLFTTIDSTNRYLKELPASAFVDICCAEMQTQGRGRFGRQWHSPFGENIYCSSRWSLHCDLSKLSGLSIVTSLAILATVQEFHFSSDMKIKWPNDILWNHKKLCGSLIEIFAESNGAIQVIIGIGLNINTDTKNQLLPDKPWCSLFELSSRAYDRNLIIAKLLKNLESYLNDFIREGLGYFIEEWNKQDYLLNKQVTLTQALHTVSGIARGIDKTGQLILEDSEGRRHYLSSGDTSLHNSLFEG